MSHRMLMRTISLCLSLAFFTAATSVEVTAQKSLPKLIKRVKSAVVLITTYNEKGQPLQQGSGFFVEKDRVITSLHVIGGSRRAQVNTFDRNIYPVQRIVATDEKRDLALLDVSVPSSGEWALEIEKAVPREGEEIIVISNPIGSPWRVSKGKTLQVWDFQNIGELISITAAIAPGSSGGPVVNIQGRVIGVATMNMKAADDLNFAVPGELVTALRHRTGPFPSDITSSNRSSGSSPPRK